MSKWYSIEVDQKHLISQRERARKLRKTQWWKMKLNQGICYYCELKFPISELTMDHIVPIARGGLSTRGNVVVAWKKCNNEKKLEIPAEKILDQSFKK